MQKEGRMNTKAELIRHVANFFGTSENMVEVQPLEVKNSMSSQIEDGLDGSIFRLYLKEENRSVIVKMKNKSFINNVGETMNYFSSQSFRESYAKGFGLFYTRNCFCREKFVYALLDENLKRFVPRYFGSIDVSEDECLHLLEDLQINQYPVNVDHLVDFLSALHLTYWNNSSVTEKMMINSPTVEDYKNGSAISHVLFENVRKLYPTFPSDILEELESFSSDGDKMFKELNFFPRTLCHGDFAVKNLTFLENQAVVYDWELATFNNPEFDLVSLLVFYPDKLDDELIESVCNRYYDKIKSKKVLHYDTNSALLFNTKLLMGSRFHAMMNIAMKVNMPFMELAIQNWICLFRHFSLSK